LYGCQIKEKDKEKDTKEEAQEGAQPEAPKQERPQPAALKLPATEQLRQATAARAAAFIKVSFLSAEAVKTAALQFQSREWTPAAAVIEICP
jgi:hypothetical protein